MTFEDMSVVVNDVYKTSSMANRGTRHLTILYENSKRVRKRVYNDGDVLLPHG